VFEHYGSHHFVVLVGQDVAVVQKPGELDELVLRHAEVRILADCGVVGGRGPPHSHHVDCVWRHKGGIFPSSAIGRNVLSSVATDIFVDSVELTAIDQVVSVTIIQSQTVEPAVLASPDDVLMHVVPQLFEGGGHLVGVHGPDVVAEVGVGELELGEAGEAEEV